MLRKKTSANPSSYKIEILTDNYAHIGRHDLVLHVGLASFPLAKEAQVEFSVMIEPCIVTAYHAPPNHFWEYTIGKVSNFMFNFS
jgi:hypothetical protein